MFCGLDFGTSNSTIAVPVERGARLIPLEDDHTTLPTAVFYDEADGIDIGRAAAGRYLSGEPGRLMRSIKSVLGTELIDETTSVGVRKIAFRQVIRDFIGAVKRRAEADLDRTLDGVVQGRPVHFVDDNPQADRRAQDILERTLREVGFTQVHFQYEPIAAARHFETGIARETLVLVADIGGGTSDFSVVRLAPERAHLSDRSRDILGNHGIRLGGIDFDKMLSLHAVMPLLGLGGVLQTKRLPPPKWIYTNLASWPRINMLYARKTMRQIEWVIGEGQGRAFERLAHVLEAHLGHRIAADVEAAKIALSDSARTVIDLDYVETGLRAPVSARDLAQAVADSLERLGSAVDDCLRRSGVKADGIERVVLTGGSTEMPVVRDAIRARTGAAELVRADTFGAVSLGLARQAAALTASDAA